jgi:uncharacterized membrane protein
MPHSVDNPDDWEPVAPGQGLAVTAEALYLINLLLLPVIAFITLLILYFRTITNAPTLAACHLRQTLSASLWAGFLLLAVNLIIVLTGGYQSANVWMLVIIYFTCCHATLVLLGVVGLAKAMAGQCYRFPLVGRDL